jgi:hypothetical protein
MPAAGGPDHAVDAGGYVDAEGERYVVCMPIGWMRFWFLGVMPLPAHISLLVFAWHPSRATGLTALFVTLMFVSTGFAAYWFLAERRLYRDAVVAAVDAAGVYLGGPPRRIPWSRVAELVVGWILDPESGDGTHFLMVVSAARRLPRAWQAVPAPRTLGTAQDLPRRADLAAVQAVVRRYARHVAVRRYDRPRGEST